jgi:hypothetical protein
VEHLKNILAGVGDVLLAFGTAPQYRYPTVGERAKDVDQLNGDFSVVGKRLKGKAERALREAHGKADNRETAAEGLSSHRLAA